MGFMKLVVEVFGVLGLGCRSLGVKGLGFRMGFSFLYLGLRVEDLSVRA